MFAELWAPGESEFSASAADFTKFTKSEVKRWQNRLSSLLRRGFLDVYPPSSCAFEVERFAIDVLLCARSLTQAAALLGLSWDEVDHILRRAVERGLSRRELEALTHVGIDEKSFRAGQSYISLLTDLQGRRVLDGVEGRTEAAAQALWETLSAEQREPIEAVAVDMWEPFLKASRAKAPQAELVHDKFHVSAQRGGGPGAAGRAQGIDGGGR
jgi:transposase